MEKQESRGVSKLSPHLVIDGAANAIEFYKKAFGAKELMRLAGQDGKMMHACVSINDASVMLVDENREWKALGPKTLGGTPVTIHLMVDNVDRSFAQAVAAGAKVVAG
jgi:PhnB protein